jgi:isocitrate dehydrogenase kinase/phosphatase
MTTIYCADVYVCVTVYIEADDEKQAQAMLAELGNSVDQIAARDIGLGDGVNMSPAVTFYPQGIPFREGARGVVLPNTVATVSEW